MRRQGPLLQQRTRTWRGTALLSDHPERRLHSLQQSLLGRWLLHRRRDGGWPSGPLVTTPATRQINLNLAIARAAQIELWRGLRAILVTLWPRIVCARTRAAQQRSSAIA